MPFSIPWMEVDSIWICVVHYLACLCPTVGSVVYHLFMNHVGGEHVYDTLLSLDMVGVCLVNTLGESLLAAWPTFFIHQSSTACAPVGHFLHCSQDAGGEFIVTLKENICSSQSPDLC